LPVPPVAPNTIIFFMFMLIKTSLSLFISQIYYDNEV
jgi:hypothetical protein